MGNRYTSPPASPPASPTASPPASPKSFVINDARQAMDVILELSEQKMNEGDYLKISKCLKVIHDIKSNNIVSTYKILNISMIEPNAVYRLTDEEVIQVMRSRYKYYYEFCITELEKTIAENQLLLIQTTHDKKTAWTKFRDERTDDKRKEHKQLVQKEKITKANIDRHIAQIQKYELILDEYSSGNYTRVHL